MQKDGGFGKSKGRTVEQCECVHCAIDLIRSVLAARKADILDGEVQD